MSTDNTGGAVENGHSETSVLEAIIGDGGLAVVRSNPELASYARDISAFLDGLRHWGSAAIESLREFSKQFRPHIEYLALFVEDERISNTIMESGLVPHFALYPNFIDVDDARYKKIATTVATKNWANLRPSLELTNAQCLNDRRLKILFTQMLDCQQFCQYEMVPTALPSVIERAVRLTGTCKEGMSPKEWLKSEFVTVSALGGVHGLRVWRILFDKSYSQCWTDDEADAIGYPNRHALAHGLGSDPATCIDSLNAILLANTIIRLAGKIQDRGEIKPA